jgi:hypothetical protein
MLQSNEHFIWNITLCNVYQMKSKEMRFQLLRHGSLA